MLGELRHAIDERGAHARALRRRGLDVEDESDVPETCGAPRGDGLGRPPGLGGEIARGMFERESPEPLGVAPEALGLYEDGVASCSRGELSVRESLQEAAIGGGGPCGESGIEGRALERRMQAREQLAVGIAATEGLVTGERRLAIELVEVEALARLVRELRIAVLAHEAVVGGRSVLLERLLPGAADAAAEGGDEGGGQRDAQGAAQVRRSVGRVRTDLHHESLPGRVRKTRFGPPVIGRVEDGLESTPAGHRGCIQGW